MAHIPNLREIREAFREEHGRVAEALAERVAQMIGEAQPGLFDRAYLPHPHAAAYLGISVAQLKKLRQARIIEPSFVDGHSYYYARADLDAYMAGQRGKLNPGDE